MLGKKLAFAALTTTMAAGASVDVEAAQAPFQELPGVTAWAQAVHSLLLSKYTPVDQWNDDGPYRNHSGLVPFEGDCDDYFTAAWNRLSSNGLRPFALVMRKKADPDRGHIVACTKTDDGVSVCLDPQSPRVVKREYYASRYTDFEERY